MIIGKSLTALGGGGLKPEIIVTAKAGALLNLHYKDSSIILQSYQLGAEETQHTFVVSVNETAYVVDDATNDFSAEVLVDVVAVFEAEIQYTLWLYRDGDECEDITGGWINGNAGTGQATEIFTKNATDLYLCATGKYGYSGKVYALLSKSINLKDCKKILIEIKSLEARAGQNLARYYAYGGIVIKSEQAEQYTELPFVVANSVATISFSGNKSIDISSYSGNVNIGLYANGNVDAASICKMNVSKVWLE